MYEIELYLNSLQFKKYLRKQVFEMTSKQISNQNTDLNFVKLSFILQKDYKALLKCIKNKSTFRFSPNMYINQLPYLEHDDIIQLEKQLESVKNNVGRQQYVNFDTKDKKNDYEFTRNVMIGNPQQKVEYEDIEPKLNKNDLLTRNLKNKYNASKLKTPVKTTRQNNRQKKTPVKKAQKSKSKSYSPVPIHMTQAAIDDVEVKIEQVNTELEDAVKAANDYFESYKINNKTKYTQKYPNADDNEYHLYCLKHSVKTIRG